MPFKILPAFSLNEIGRGDGLTIVSIISKEVIPLQLPPCFPKMLTPMTTKPLLSCSSPHLSGFFLSFDNPKTMLKLSKKCFVIQSLTFLPQLKVTQC